MNAFEKFVMEHIDKPWEWGRYGLSYNPSITMKFVTEHLDQPWDWDWGRGGLSSNPSITMKFVNDNIDQPWNWRWLSSSPFTKDIQDQERRERFQRLHRPLIEATWKTERVLDWCLDFEERQEII